MFSTDELVWDELISGLSGRLIQGDLEGKASGVSTDTRTLKAGDLFIALKGPRFNGHDHVRQAFEKGAAAVLVSELTEPGILPADKLVIQVKDTLSALGDLASLWRRKFPVTLIGISGSNGKTTTKEMLAAILEQEGPTLKNPGNMNNWIGLPLSLFSLDGGHRFAVMEMGMNHSGEIARLCQIARPSVGLLTNIGPAHLEGLGTLSAVARAKGELFEALEPDHWGVVNWDDPRIRDLARTCKARKITFGQATEAQVRADRLSLTDRGTRFRILFQGEEEIFLPIQGAHNISNALGAAATALALGLSLERVRQGLKDFQLPEHRLQIKKGILGVRLIDDTYNANPASMKAALNVFQSLRQGTRGGLVLGDMLELGNQSSEAHKEIGRMIGTMGVDYLLGLGPFSEEMLTEAQSGLNPPQKAFWASDHKKTIDLLRGIIREGDWLLVKGSHGLDMESIVRVLEEQE
ncbi:MAG: UDP-N-acetylmuramoyl-tripeptide--D-alanyl-D-alanine ligase [Thermodesulfobacteriota bacterium]|jgi:UDP-N-acetylmuramoyl-tripeptide--D-alanyl-D-alanine ligase